MTKMPDKKLTDIKELLEYKAKVGCQNCDLIGKGCCSTCVNSLIKSFIGLFDRLQAEKQDLEIELQAMRGAANSYKEENKRLSTLAELGNKRADDYRVMRDRALKAEKEVERLEKENQVLQDQCDYWRTEAKTARLELIQAPKKAYKEFAERLKKEIDIRPTHSNEQNKYVFFLIDNLLKELVGEDK